MLPKPGLDPPERYSTKIQPYFLVLFGFGGLVVPLVVRLPYYDESASILQSGDGQLLPQSRRLDATSH